MAYNNRNGKDIYKAASKAASIDTGNTALNGAIKIVAALVAVVFLLYQIGVIPNGGGTESKVPENAKIIEPAEKIETQPAAGPEGTYEWTTWNPDTAPNYYRIAGKAVITHPEVGVGEIEYGPLDALGRATWACGQIDTALYAKELEEEREQKLPNPAGWPSKNPEVDMEYWNGYVYHGNFWNRSHMIADSLGGDPIKQNLVPGTRTQNTGTNNAQGSGYGGMAYTEELARQFLQDALDAKRGLVLYYCATPVYEGSELIPRSVYVDIRSSDDSIDLHVETFNAVRNFTINYSTGEFQQIL
jgi:DNA-entry nuclease